VKITQNYVATYADYICNDDTKMKKVTLSGLCLGKTDEVTAAWKKLSEVLSLSADDKNFRRAILAARKKTKSFVAGLYVDVCDLCEQLIKQLSAKAITDVKLHEQVMEACDAVCAALRHDAGFVIANSALEKHCHGISVYFPYVASEDQAELKRAGGLREKGGLDVPLKLSMDRVEIIEKEYDSLRFSRLTGWNKFIKHDWSRILAEQEPENLDLCYSAKQCALNLLSLCQEGTKSGKEPTLSVGAQPQPKGNLPAAPGKPPLPAAKTKTECLESPRAEEPELVTR
jgi:hypothetical protein